VLRRAACVAVLATAVLAGCGSSETTLSIQTVTFGSTPSPSASAGLATIPPASGAPAADVIDATAARALVDGWNTARAQAERTLDASPLSAVEASPALDTDRVTLALARAGAVRRPVAASVDSIAVATPHQSTFPAVVYATQRTTRGSTSVIEVLAFVRASQSSGWTLSWHASTPDAKTTVPDPQLGADGLAVANLDATGQHALVADVPSLASRLAASFRPGAPTDRAIVLDQGMPDIGATARATIASFSRSGASAGVQFTGAPTPVAVQTTDGGAACIVVVTYTATLASAPGHPLVETASQHPYSQGLLASGSYAQIVDTYVFTFAVSVPATTGGVTMFVYAIGGGIAGAAGVPAPPATPSP
jgi:hypothetical protein